MKHPLLNVFVCLIVFVLACAAVADRPVEIRATDGSKWRGEIGSMVELTMREGRGQATITGELLEVADLYVVVKGKLAGKMTKKIIFKSDLISIRTVEASASDDKPPSAGGKEKVKPEDAAEPAEKTKAEKVDPKRGVFFLPLEGPLGTTLRHEEIDLIGKHADEYGPGQLIVLSVSSNGGTVSEGLKVRDSIFELARRHRVVARIQKALSGGASTAMCCEEIYFTTEGVCGSVTAIVGHQAIQGEAQTAWTDEFVKIVVRQGYSEHIGRSMTASRHMCSYDKDEKTGAVTFYGDMSGKYPLSDDKSNLCFNSSNALDCGFSKGTADTEEELAKFLQLPKWYEIDDYGRKIAEEWQETCEQAEKEIPRILARLQYKGSGGDMRARLGAQINLLKQLVRWWDRCPNVVASKSIPPKEDLQRQIEEMRRQLARMR